MGKITTAKIKLLMGEWLKGDDETKMNMRHLTGARDGEPTHVPDEETLKYSARLFDFKEDCTVDELHDHIWNLWIDPKQWRRESKGRLGDEWKSFLANGPGKYVKSGNHVRIEREAGFASDFLDGSDEQLVQKYFSNPALAKKCWLRSFVPNNQLEDGHRLEVVTTPEDDEIIGWIVFRD